LKPTLKNVFYKVCRQTPTYPYFNFIGLDKANGSFSYFSTCGLTFSIE